MQKEMIDFCAKQKVSLEAGYLFPSKFSTEILCFSSLVYDVSGTFQQSLTT
jgi:hypothetical protein